jgi:hypothetical protein
MNDLRPIKNLRSQSTWILLGLGIITYGVYFAYYIQRQSKEINTAVSISDKIPSYFIYLIFFMSYLSLALCVAYIAIDDVHGIGVALTLVDRICWFLIIVWGLKARNRVNSLCGLSRESKEWFHGLWTLLFSPLYFNYKVNCIVEVNANSSEQTDL